MDCSRCRSTYSIRNPLTYRTDGRVQTTPLCEDVDTTRTEPAMMENSNPTNVLEPVGPARQQTPSPAADRNDAPASRKTGVLAWLGRAIPTAIVLAALGGLAYWGHHTGWAVPTFAALAGSGVKEKDDWCGEHGVPESQCVECNADLLPRGKDFGWCRKHGIPDCPFEHPEVAQLQQ